MKFVTWNVNGLKACIEKGLEDYLRSTDADIIALQETKVNALFNTPFMSEYKVSWNHSLRPGYSGTVCLYKEKPLSVVRQLGDKKLDAEGRLISLEYPAFYFVNVYVPKSQDNLERWCFRLEWDSAFIKFIKGLQNRKPVIICGDFNVARDFIDIYPENLRNLKKPYGFLTEERDSFNALLGMGLSDVFRELNPDMEGAYTWWSNRLKKRRENRGWRLDYFLISEGLLPSVSSCIIKSAVQGSDHAPLELTVDFGNLIEDALEKSWRGINWKKAGETLKKLQRDIAFASLKRDKSIIYRAQKRLINSTEARALAVRQVASSHSQPGIDGVVWKTDAKKMKAASALDSRGYTAQPMRLVIIVPRGQTKQRYVHIPTHFDKAMQTLHAYSLDPVAETTGERKSFAFRKGRSTQDVHAYIMRAFDVKEPPRYVLKGDVKACYGSISHEWLLENIPMDITVLREFLKAGHVFRDEIFPPDDFGISLGSSISPILGNMTLDGAQRVIYETLHGSVYGIDYADGDLIRFADDIIVTARTKESAIEIKRILCDFLAVRGLELSEEKTRIIAIEEGFVFLSRHYQFTDGIVYATPSDAAVERMEQSLRELIRKYRGGQKALINAINGKLKGWASYHRVTEAGQAFRHIDNAVKALLLELCETLNPNMPREKVINKYFYREPDGEYIYALKNKPDIRVCRLADTVLINHKPIEINKNPYIDDKYFEERTGERAIMAVTGKYKTIWNRQGGKCLYCGNTILKDSHKAIVAVDPRRPQNTKNMAYIHEYCSRGQTEFIKSEREIDSRFDLYELLVRMHGSEEKSKKGKGKFSLLAEHFRQRRDTVFTLTFNEIEDIIGKPLCNDARKNKYYWAGNSDNGIKCCWQVNGYAARNVNLKKAQVVFERSADFGGVVSIPSIFLTERIPHDAKVEVENMFDYIRKKYGI